MSEGIETSPAAQMAALSGQIRELRAELDQVRADRGRLTEIQARIMELVGSRSSDRLIHDLRNVLNERDLLKALVDEL